MSALRTDGSSERAWYQEPAWVSLFLTLLLQLCVFAYLYGKMADKVDTLERNDQMIMQHLLQHANEGPAR